MLNKYKVDIKYQIFKLKTTETLFKKMLDKYYNLIYIYNNLKKFLFEGVIYGYKNSN